MGFNHLKWNPSKAQFVCDVIECDEKYSRFDKIQICTWQKMSYFIVWGLKIKLRICISMGWNASWSELWFRDLNHKREKWYSPFTTGGFILRKQWRHFRVTRGHGGSLRVIFGSIWTKFLGFNIGRNFQSQLKSHIKIRFPYFQRFRNSKFIMTRLNSQKFQNFHFRV